MRSVLFFALLSALCGNARAIEDGSHDPEFARVPFNEWAAGAKQDRIHWSLELAPPELSTHQRMLVRVGVRIDGREFERRRGHGEFVAFFQYQDAAGHVWQDHAAFDLENLQPGMERNEVVIGHFAFALPGDYSLTVAVWHSTSGDHALARRRLHVGDVSSDPLPGAWSGLPPIEIIRNPSEPPDVWFLPDIQTHLRLPVANTKPVHVEILVNTTPSGRSAGSVSATNRNMSLLVPALKVLSAMQLHGGTIDLALLDLTHRKTTFMQRAIRELDWLHMRTVLLEAKPGVVDVSTLQNEWKMRQFFVDEVIRRLENKQDSPHVVIVLSGPAFLTGQEPIEPRTIPADPDRRLFYIRYRGSPSRIYAVRRPRPGARPMPPRPTSFPMEMDDLEKAVQPMNARLYDAASPEQFRRILASIIDQMRKF